MSEKSTSLYFKEGGSDKEYHVYLRPKISEWVVDYANGKRGQTLRTGTRTLTPLPLDAAQKKYDKLVAEKKREGYTEDESGAAYTSSELAGRASEHRQQLPTEIGAKTSDLLMYDDDWCLQEKANGERRTLIIQDGEVRGVNKKGLYVDIPQEWVLQFRALGNVEIDGEAMGDRFMAFDLLAVEGVDWRPHPFEKRYEMLEAMYRDMQHAAPSLRLLTAHFTSETKRAETQRIQCARLEGWVFKLKRAPYEAGRSEVVLKRKLKESSTCFVLHRNQQRSVGLGLFDAQRQIVPVGNVTIAANEMVPGMGDLVEVQYLYYNGPGGSFQEPVYLGQRNDVSKDECTLSQVKRFKPDEVVEGGTNQPAGILARNDPSLIIVPDWAKFCAWAKDGGGYDESYFDLNDEKCLRLQREFLDEQEDRGVERQKG